MPAPYVQLLAVRPPSSIVSGCGRSTISVALSESSRTRESPKPPSASTPIVPAPATTSSRRVSGRMRSRGHDSPERVRPYAAAIFSISVWKVFAQDSDDFSLRFADAFAFFSLAAGTPLI